MLELSYLLANLSVLPLVLPLLPGQETSLLPILLLLSLLLVPPPLYY